MQSKPSMNQKIEDLNNFNEKTFEKYLSTYNIPDPELIIRTSGEERISNFYLWQAAYSELYFTDILWPDFNKKELNNAIFEFEKEIEGLERFNFMRLYIIISVILLGFNYKSFSQIRYNLNNDQQIAISYTNPKTYEVAEIKVEGEKYLDEIALKSLAGIKVGDKISIPGESISGAIKKLWKQGIIGDIKIIVNKIEDEKVYLSIVLKERPRLSTFEINGIGRTQKSELTEKINLIRGRIVTDAVIKNTQNTIENYFKKKGFFNTIVDVKQETDTIVSNSIKLKINVSKSKKVKFNNINFIGNSEFSDAKLKGKLKKSGERVRIPIFKEIFKKSTELLKPKNLFGSKYGISLKDLTKFITDNAKINLLKSSKYITSELDNDKDNLISFYQSKGYRDIKILDEKISRDGDYVDLELTLDPGNQYYFRNINWTGNYIYNEDLLNEVLAISKGDVYDTETLEKNNI